jgi:Uma2 family endonuclease
MSVTIPQVNEVWTEAELQALPDDGYTHEVVNGRLIMSPKNNFFHERICMKLTVALERFATEKGLGVVLGSSAGFWMHNRNCRAPDISFIAKTRLLRMGFKPDTRTFFPGAPDLAVEVLSVSNSPAEIQNRLDDFFGSGTELAWIVHPDEEFVQVCHSPLDRKILGKGAMLDGEQLLPGFQFPIADLFKGWDWE